MDYHTAWDNLKRTDKKAGVQKPVNLHFFRHIRASYLAKTLTEAQLKVYLGWSAGSSCFRCGMHLTSDAQKEESNTEDIMKKILLDPEIMGSHCAAVAETKIGLLRGSINNFSIRISN